MTLGSRRREMQVEVRLLVVQPAIGGDLVTVDEAAGKWATYRSVWSGLTVMPLHSVEGVDRFGFTGGRVDVPDLFALRIGDVDRAVVEHDEVVAGKAFGNGLGLPVLRSQARIFLMPLQAPYSRPSGPRARPLALPESSMKSSGWPPGLTR